MLWLWRTKKDSRWRFLCWRLLLTQERYGERQVGMGWLLAGVVRTRILEIKGNFDGVLVGGRKLLNREKIRGLVEGVVVGK